VRFRVSIAIGGILLLLGAAATAPATTTARPPTRVTIVAPRLAQPGEIVRVDGRVIGGSSIVAPALFRVSEAGSTIRRKFIRIHESRFRTWTRFSKPGVYRVSVFYPGDSGSGGGSGHLPSSASVKIRVT
jgi:hypothetical protein